MPNGIRKTFPLIRQNLPLGSAPALTILAGELMNLSQTAQNRWNEIQCFDRAVKQLIGKADT